MHFYNFTKITEYNVLGELTSEASVQLVLVAVLHLEVSV